MKNLRKIIFTKTALLFMLIICCAGFFRLTYLQFIEFKADEALNLFLATRPLFGHSFPPASLASSVGILNFPLLNYFLFPFVSISTYPPFVSLCIALVNTLAIGWFFLILKRYFSTLTAFLTTILFSFAPWAILYSRKIWAQDFILPLVIALLFAFFKIYFEKNAKYYFLYILIGLLLLQIHQTTGILPTLLFPFLFIRQKPKLNYAIYGLVLGLLPTLPYIYYQLITGCPDCSVFSVAKSHFVAFHPEMFLRPFEIVSTGNFYSIFGSTDYAAFAVSQKLTYTLMKSSYLLYILLPISSFFFYIKTKKFRLFPIVIAVILLLFFLLRIDPQIHYVILLLPFLFLFLGFFLSFLITSHSRFLQVAGLGIVVILIGNSLLFDTTFFRLLSQKGGFGGDYGGSFAVVEQKAQQDLRSYQHNPDYKEILLAYYAPKEFIEGSTPVGKMLYPYDTVKPEIPHFTQEILSSKTSLPDPRVVNTIWAFYTYPQNATPATFAQLRMLGKQSNIFAQLATAAYNNYLTTNYKHSFSNSDFLFEYPSYWSIVNTNDIKVSDDHVAVTITRNMTQQDISHMSCTSQPIRIAHSPTMEYVCLTGKKIWSQTIVSPLPIDGTIYTITMHSISQLTPQIIQKEQGVFKEILSSFTIF